MATEVNESNLGEKLEIARRRFDELYARSLSSPGELTLLPEALHELSTSIEELTATAEELKQQNEKLAAMRGLVEAERRHFQELFESAPDGYLVTDTQGIIQEANSNAAKLLHMRQDFLEPIIVYLPQPAHASFH